MVTPIPNRGNRTFQKKEQPDLQGIYSPYHRKGDTKQW
jgi:hypothetical protein